MKEDDMSVPSDSASELLKVIKDAIADGKITPEERDRIMMTADEDGVIDPQERSLLGQLQDLIQSGAVRLAAK